MESFSLYILSGSNYIKNGPHTKKNETLHIKKVITRKYCKCTKKEARICSLYLMAYIVQKLEPNHKNIAYAQKIKKNKCIFSILNRPHSIKNGPYI